MGYLSKSARTAPGASQLATARHRRANVGGCGSPAVVRATPEVCDKTEPYKGPKSFIGLSLLPQLNDLRISSSSLKTYRQREKIRAASTTRVSLHHRTGIVCTACRSARERR